MKYIAILLFLILGCSSPSLPKWYLNTPKDNSLYLYGSGEGATKQEAINSALSFIASKLKVKISSTFQSEKSLIATNSSENTYKNSSEYIKASVENFTFYNYDTEKIKKIDDRYYALVRINKEKNSQKLLNEIEEKIKNLPPLTSSEIQNIQTAKKALETLKSLKAKYALAKILNPSIEKIDFDTLEKRYQKAMNATFNIKSNNPYLQNEIASFISKKFALSAHPSILINANIKTKTKKIVGEYLTNAFLKVNIKDSSLEKNYFYQCAASSFNKEISKKLAVKRCTEKLKNLLNSLF